MIDPCTNNSSLFSLLNTSGYSSLISLSISSKICKRVPVPWADVGVGVVVVVVVAVGVVAEGVVVLVVVAAGVEGVLPLPLPPPLLRPLPPPLPDLLITWHSKKNTN